MRWVYRLMTLMRRQSDEAGISAVRVTSSEPPKHCTQPMGWPICLSHLYRITCVIYILHCHHHRRSPLFLLISNRRYSRTMR